MVTFSKLGEPEFGRLGNQLFQIAATIGIADENQCEFVFPEWSYSSSFKNPLPISVCSDCTPYIVEDSNFKAINLLPGDWDLRGFFQSEKYFINSKLKVLHYFDPADQVKEYLWKKYDETIVRKSCSIHVRRGDYAKQSHYFPMQPLEYYLLAISKFPKNTLFLVFSDEIAWCKKNFLSTNFTFVENESDINDLILMSNCQNHILSNSSFSWWGAWLNDSDDKIILCPENWFGPAVAFNSKNFTADIYAKDFIKVYLPKTTLLRKYPSVLNPPIYLFYLVKNFFIKIAKTLVSKIRTT